MTMAPPQQNGHIHLAREAAEALLKRGIMPLPVPFGVKHPSDRKGWQNERYAADNLTAFDFDRLNVGMRLGHITSADGAILTDRFVDVDLDCPEAVRAARLGILPETGMIWGRASNPRSHYGYRLSSLDGARSINNLNDPLNPRTDTGKADARICELRFQGQTLAPGSTNMESGVPEKVRWEQDGDGDPATVTFAELERRVLYLYAVALLARYWREGIRHDAALPLAGLLARGGMSEASAVLFVEHVCKIAGESEADIANRLGCVRDTYAKAAAGQPFTAGPTLEDYIDKKVVESIRRRLDLKRLGTLGDIGPDGLALTDVGNAERFAVAYEGRFLWCDDESQWYVYEAGVWMPDRRQLVKAAVKDLIRQFRTLANDPNRPKVGNATPKQIDDHIREWQRSRSIAATINLAQAELTVLPEQFDSDPWLLNVLDGTVILGRDGSHHLRVHRWQDLLTKQWQAHYNPEATHFDLDQYRLTFVPERERWEFIEEALGYSLTGLPKRYNFQLIGPSHSGKSMLLRFIRTHSGAYGAALKYSALKPDYHDGGDKPRSDLLVLRGARVLTVAEVGEGTIWDGALFKTMLSGGDVYTVRGAYERRAQSFSFTVSLWTSGNDAYGANASDDAAYERVHVIKFDHPMPEGARDDAREDEVVDPARTGDAFLACALRGFSRLYGQKGGRLIPPDDVRGATAEMRNQLDPFTLALERMFEFTGDPDDGVLKSEANAAAKTLFQQDNPRYKWGILAQGDLRKAMERRGAILGHDRTHFQHREYWRGVRWTSTFAAEYVVTVEEHNRGEDRTASDRTDQTGS